jgi:phage tail-like protein
MKQSEIAALLPDVFRRVLDHNEPLAALIKVMEAMHAPSEQILGGLDSYFDPYQAPERFVPFLASWVDMDRLLSETAAELDEAALPFLFETGLGRLRELIAAAADLARWRGTARGLILFLQTAIGVAGFAIEEDVSDEQGRPQPFHIWVRAPAAAEPFELLVRRIIEMEKPAYVTYDLLFANS